MATAAAQKNPLLEWIERYDSEDGIIRFVKEQFGATPDAEQEEALRAIARGERRISIRSGHGVGKTTLLAWAIVWHVLIKYPQKTVCTAPTSSQLYDALASECKAWIGKLPLPIQSLLEVKSERIELKSDPSRSFVAFNTSRPEKPEAMAGVHSAHVLLVADEASGIPEPVFEAAIGSMSGHNACTILAGNPVRTQGLFHATHTNADLIKDWRRIHISCVGHPRVSDDFVKQVIATYGIDSNAYRVRVLGEFPLADDNTVIPYELMEMALMRDVKPLSVRQVWGLDVARFGSDRSALARRRGNVLVSPVQFWGGLDTMELVGRVKGEYDMCSVGDKPEEILVDVIGIGAGVVDRLRELKLPVRGINVSESPALGEKFRNLRAELLWAARDWFTARDCSLGGDRTLGLELTAIKYKITPNGKIQVESKDDMKKRGLRSPDLGDAFVLTFASNAATALGGSSKKQSWATALKRKISIV